MQTGERDRACNLAKTNPVAGLNAARRIKGPLMRCQALAWVARYSASDAGAVEVAREAEEVLEDAEDIWEAVAGAAWIVRALAERGRENDADAMLLRAVPNAPRIVKKADAVQRDLVLMLAGGGRDFSGALAALAEGKAKRQAERRLSAREFMSPRPFFW